MKTDAYLSNDRLYRYWLLRIWDDSLPLNCCIGNNPSTADEKKNDPTIRKEIGFSQRTGFGGLLKLNVGAYRATNPKVWLNARDPFGPENSIAHLLEYIRKFQPKQVAATWGRCIGRYANRGVTIASNIPDIMCYGRNSDGTPRHTLMLPYTTQLEPWSRP